MADEDDRPVADTRIARRWGLVFLLAGLPAAFSAMVLPFDPALALPWVIVFWPVTVYAGYRIWRAQNPTASARAAIATRARMVAEIIARTIGSLD
jgi:hypothetical protein